MTLRRFATILFEYILVLLIIIEFNTPYMYFKFIATPVKYIPILLLGLLLTMRGTKINGLFLLLILGAFLPMMNVAEGHMKDFVRLYMLVFPILYLYLRCSAIEEGIESFRRILIKFSDIVVVLAAVSLFFFIFGSMLEQMPYTALIPNNWGGDKFIPTYYGIYFETQETSMTEGAETLVRNSGIFNEAPMHNMVLCIAMSIELFIRKRLSIIRTLILFAAIISTISTTGYIVLLIMSALKIYSIMGNRLKRLFILFSPIILFLLFLVFSAILENKKETGEGSYNSRSRDIERCIEVGMENPVIGLELFHKGEEEGAGVNDFGYSNSLFGVFAHGGLYTFSLYLGLLFIIPFLCYWKTKDRNFLFMQFCFFTLFTFTVSQYKYLTILFMAISLAYWDVYVLNKKSLNSNC